MKACNDLDFLTNYWKEAKNIAFRIKKRLTPNNRYSS